MSIVSFRYYLIDIARKPKKIFKVFNSSLYETNIFDLSCATHVEKYENETTYWYKWTVAKVHCEGKSFGICDSRPLPPNWLWPRPPVGPNESLIWRISEFIIIKITRCLQCCLYPPLLSLLYVLFMACKTLSLRLLPLTWCQLFGFRSWHSSTFCVNVTESDERRERVLNGDISQCFCHFSNRKSDYEKRLISVNNCTLLGMVIEKTYMLANELLEILFDKHTTTKWHFVIIFVIIPALGNVNSFALLSVCTAAGLPLTRPLCLQIRCVCLT